MNTMIKVLCCALAAIAVTNVHAQKGSGPADVMTSVGTQTSLRVPPAPNSDPDSSVVLNLAALGPLASWDGLGDASNVIANCVRGTAITGIQWDNVTIETIGLSWLSDPVMFFSDSAAGGGIFLAVGAGDDMPGIATYSSGGVIDLTDNALPDILALPDGQFRIEFFEGFDDVADAIDANFTSGKVVLYGQALKGTPGAGCPLGVAGPLAVPSLQWYGLAALAFGLLLITRRALRA